MNIVVKRFLSYLIDMFIIFVFIFLFSLFFDNKYEAKINDLNQLLLEEKIEYKEYKNLYYNYYHSLDKENIYINIYTIILILLFFVLIPLNTGQTIGQKVFKIKIISDNKLTKEDLIGRSIIINGLGFLLFMLIILYLVNDKIYFILINFFAFLQIIVVIINFFMVLYSYKNCGIADKFTNTRIEEIK